LWEIDQASVERQFGEYILERGPFLMEFAHGPAAIIREADDFLSGLRIRRRDAA
jgi:hypothetical protein